MVSKESCKKFYHQNDIHCCNWVLLGRRGGGGGGEESKVKLTTPKDLRWLIAYLLLDYANGTEFMFTIKI